MSAGDDPDLVRLETKVAYQDKLIAELNDVVVGLNRDLTDLTRRLATVERMLRSELERRDMPNERPPHY